MKTPVSQTALLLTLLVTLWIAPSLQAQPTFDWANLLTSAPQPHDSLDAASDPEGNLIIAYMVWDSTATSIESSTTWVDHVVTKLDPDGNVLWSLAVLPNIHKIVTDTSGSVYVAGSLLRGNPLTPLLPDDYFTTRGIATEGVGTAYIAKISSSGVLEWVRRDGGSAVVDANAVALGTDGSYYVAGFYTRGAAQIGATLLPAPATTNARNVFVAYYSPGGYVQWVRVGETQYEQTGQGGIVVDRSGSLLLAWSSGGTISFGEGAGALTGLFLVKYDPLGNLLWARNTSRAYGGRQLAVDHDGNAFVASRSAASMLVLDKYGPNGSLLWSRQPQVNSDSASYTGIAVDSQGNCFAGGYFGGTSPPPDYPFLPGDISFEGKSVTNVASQFELFVVKYSGSGDATWALQTIGLEPLISGYLPERVSDTRTSSIVTSPQGGVFISGVMRGTVEFGTTTLIGQGWRDGGLGIFASHILEQDIVRPQLSMRIQIEGLRLSWPVSFSGFVLETTAALTVPAWNTVPTAPVRDGDQNVVIVETGGSGKFFRLSKP